MQHYPSYRSYLRRTFGMPVLKVSLNAGFTCPNRDGTVGTHGCTFCDNRAFSSAVGLSTTPVEQMRAAMARSAGRVGAFLAYLQPYTNTHAPVDTLRQIYEPLVALDRVVGLAVATRPDCVPPDVVEYLGDLARRTYVSVELGLQSTHDATLRAVNRGHTYADFVDAVRRLDAQGIESVAHVILGLPGETIGMMTETARRLAGLPVRGVKIHQLMIVRGTQLEQWHAEGRAPVLTLEEYARALCVFLEHLRPDQHIHRIVADSTAQRGLVAPQWSADKQATIRFLHAYMDNARTVQGGAFAPT